MPWITCLSSKEFDDDANIWDQVNEDEQFQRRKKAAEPEPEEQPLVEDFDWGDSGEDFTFVRKKAPVVEEEPQVAEVELPAEPQVTQSEEKEE